MGHERQAEEDLDRLPTDEELLRLQRTTVLYYLHETNPDNGLVRDKTDPAAPCSIAAVGLALATIPAIVQRGVIIRKFAAKIARRRLRSLIDLPQGPEPDAAGYKGSLGTDLGHHAPVPRTSSRGCAARDSQGAGCKRIDQSQ